MVTAAPPSKVAGSPRSDDDKAGPSCRPIVLLLGPTQTDRKKFRVGTENAVLQPADTGRVARAFRAARDRQRFRKDRTAGCEKVVGIRFALDSSLEQRRFELSVPP